MSKAKKRVRELIRDAVFARDGNRCRLCDTHAGSRCRDIDEDAILDPHHITDRSNMPNGGYVASNIISLCQSCHADVEDVAHGQLDDLKPAWVKECSSSNLYKLIGSSYETALRDSEAL